MKQILYLLIGLLLFSCKTSKKVTEKIVTKDSLVYVEKVRVDTVKIVETKTITEPIYNEIEIPCDSLDYYQKIANGKVQFKVVKEKGKVKIIYKQDSLVDKYKLLYFKSINKLDSISKIKNISVSTQKEVIQKTFWQSLLENIWKILFFIILVLWILGITPRFIISKVF